VKQKELTGTALKRLRESKGLKATFIAAKLNVSPSYLSMLEAGTRVWDEQLRKRYLEAIGE
jgi:transcriptional regulator with XRE-family HTH domain